MKTRLLIVLVIALSFAGCSKPLTGACKQIHSVDNSNLFDRLDPSKDPNTIRKDVQSVQKDLVKLKTTAPATLTDDVNKFSDGIDKIDTLLGNVNYNAEKLSTDAGAKAQLAQINKDSQPSAKAIDDYFNKSC